MMKTKHFLILAIAGLGILSGCKKENLHWEISNKDIVIKDFYHRCSIQILNGTLSFTAVVDAVAADWCTVDAIYYNSSVSAEGRGIVQIDLAIEPNLIAEQRIALVTVSGEGRSEVVTITQEAGDATLSIDHTIVELEYAAGTCTIPVVTNNASWTATVEAAATWCTLTTASGKGNGTVTISTREATFKRHATVFVNTGALRDSVIILQHGMPVHDPGVNIDGVIWATRNVNDFGTFAGWLNEVGKFYRFNRGRAYTTTDPLFPAWDDTYPENGDWSLINDPCPEGWRVPSIAEYRNLVTSGWRWVTADESGLGIPGAWFGSGALDADPYPTVPNDAVFFPAVGARITLDGQLISVNNNTNWDEESGWYWPKDGMMRWPEPLRFDKSGHNTWQPSCNPLLAMSIRCVKR